MPEGPGQEAPAGQPTTEQLREALHALGDRAWQPREDLEDGAPLPTPPTGGVRERFEVAADAPAIDLREIIAPHPSSPALAQRRVELGLHEEIALHPENEQ